MEGLGTLPCFFLFEQVVDAKGRLVQREKGGHVTIPSRAQGEGGDPNPKEQGSFCEKAVLLRREKAVCFATARRWSVCRCEKAVCVHRGAVCLRSERRPVRRDKAVWWRHEKAVWLPATRRSFLCRREKTACFAPREGGLLRREKAVCSAAARRWRHEKAICFCRREKAL